MKGIQVRKFRAFVEILQRVLTTLSLGMSSKGPYRLAKTLATHSGMTKQWLEQQGLISIKELWIKFHYA